MLSRTWGAGRPHVRLCLIFLVSSLSTSITFVIIQLQSQVTLCGRYGVADVDVWPISTLLMADVLICVADLVVADMVCGRYRRFPSFFVFCDFPR